MQAMSYVMEPRLEFAVPDISKHAAGNAGVPYLYVLEGPEPGPTAMISAIVHGNEISGAVILNDLLNRNFRPARGTLILAFMNVEAFRRFDSAHPSESRLVDEDLNRVWSLERLDSPGASVELRRAKEVKPFVERADYLLDLHSTTGDGGPMLLVGMTQKALRFARSLKIDAPIIRDWGHLKGRRMRDYEGFGEEARTPIALLMESGQHWRENTLQMADDAVRKFLTALGMVQAHDALQDAPDAPVLDVTDVVTVQTEGFHFIADYQGVERIPEQGTVIAYDGVRPIVTPYDDCVLIMPTHHSRPGQTAIRFARAHAAA